MLSFGQNYCNVEEAYCFSEHMDNNKNKEVYINQCEKVLDHIFKCGKCFQIVNEYYMQKKTCAVITERPVYRESGMSTFLLLVLIGLILFYRPVTRA